MRILERARNARRELLIGIAGAILITGGVLILIWNSTGKPGISRTLGPATPPPISEEQSESGAVHAGAPGQLPAVSPDEFPKEVVITEDSWSGSDATGAPGDEATTEDQTGTADADRTDGSPADASQAGATDSDAMQAEATSRDPLAESVPPAGDDRTPTVAREAKSQDRGDEPTKPAGRGTDTPAGAQPEGPIRVPTMVSGEPLSGGPFYGIHITSFRSSARATADASRLADRTGHETTVVPVDITSSGPKTGRWYRGVGGRFATADKAQKASRSFREKGWTDYSKVYRIVD